MFGRSNPSSDAGKSLDHDPRDDDRCVGIETGKTYEERSSGLGAEKQVQCANLEICPNALG